ncbi:MAG TPA: HAMP domain-containing sensor histidine kinase [Anaerolineales bacterium]
MGTRNGIFDYLAIAEIVSQRSDWKQALDEVLAVVHSIFIFDNLALFVAEQEASSLTEIVYARAVGRGQSAGADVAWGSDIATQVMERDDIVLQEPEKSQRKGDRLGEVYLLGLPLRTSTGLYGAMVFVRFGGPSYSSEHILHARYIASQFAGLFERKKLNEDINALEEARRLLALQDDFIATISHELRTPLGFIKGYSTTLLRQDTEWDESTRREFLTIIEEEADHLTTLIENVLESARLQSNTLPMKFQPTRLDTLIVETATRAQARFKGMEVKYDFPIKPVLQLDSVRIAQVMSNLFSNAAKYSPGAPISISLTDISGYNRIRFADSGPGIASEHLNNLFKRFFRVPGQGGSGSGLGLFICKKIIDAHGGKISVESEPGMGTAFLIDLPNEPVIRTEGE